MDENIQDFPESPFEPGHPVSPDKFKGRKKDINKISRYLPKVKNQGVPFHFFITGKRGMGKTSFVKYLANEICDKYDLTPVYINNDGISSLDEFIVRLIEALLKEFHEKSIGEQLFKFVSEYVEGFNVNGTGMKLREYNPDKLITHIKNDFPEFLIKISENLTDNNKGAFIFIDDLNGLSDNLEFASWYKRSFDTLNFADERIPIAFCLVSYPEEFNNLADINPSFTRIFERIIIDHIDDEDIEEFFETVFNDPQTQFYISKCKYCGRIFIKFENKTGYCREACRTWAVREQKAKYQQKRRKLINDGELISNELREPGTTFLSQHALSDFGLEERTVKRELKRIGVKI